MAEQLAPPQSCAAIFLFVRGRACGGGGTRDLMEAKALLETLEREVEKGYPLA